MKRFSVLFIMLFVVCSCAMAHSENAASDSVDGTAAVDRSLLESYSYDELKELEAFISNKMSEMEQENAPEHGNREIKLDSDSCVLYAGQTKRIAAQVSRMTEDAPAQTNLVWRSSDESVAAVSMNGTVTAKSKGTAEITCSAKDDDTVFSKVGIEVRVPVKRIALNPPRAALVAGLDGANTVRLTASIEPEDADCTALIWKSSNSRIASVKNGVVTAHSAGSVTITAVSEDTSLRNGVQASCSITVGSAVGSISLNKTSIKTEKGKTVSLTAAVKPANAVNKKLSWSSSDAKVATVNDRGMITAVENGSSLHVRLRTDQA